MESSLPPRPERLPLLEAISWFDADPYRLTPLDMLSRYERSWRHRGVLGDPSAAELAWIMALARKYGSVLDVPA